MKQEAQGFGAQLTGVDSGKKPDFEMSLAVSVDMHGNTLLP
jgi:hypothetical protein